MRRFRVDMAIAYEQRFRVPVAFRGPQAIFIGTSEEHKRIMPRRIIRVSVGSNDKPPLRI